MYNLRTEAALLNEELKKAKAESPFAFGLQSWADSIGDASQMWADFASSAASGFSQALGDAFVDAFSSGTKNAKQIFGNFLKTLATQLAASAFAQLLAQLLSGGAPGFGSAVGAVVKGGIFAEGGSVQPHLWRIPGFAQGGHATTGRIQKDPRDNILAWLRKDEFVMRPEAVSKFGRGFMEAINNLEAPSGLISLFNSSKRTPPKSSFATGGYVQAVNPPGGNRVVVQLPTMPAAIVASEEYAERFSSGRSGRKLREQITGRPENRQTQESF
jgi:hypothetical protein